MTSPFDDLDALRQEIEADLDPEWVKEFGDASWKAALTVMGFPVDDT